MDAYCPVARDMLRDPSHNIFCIAAIESEVLPSRDTLLGGELAETSMESNTLLRAYLHTYVHALTQTHAGMKHGETDKGWAIQS